MVDNRVVIKINYDRERQQQNLINPKMITVWHKGRIFSVLCLVILLSIALFWGLSHDGSGEKEHVDAIPPGVAQTEVHGLPSSERSFDHISTADSGDHETQDMVIGKPVGIIFDKRVIRASINRVKEDPGTSTSVLVEAPIRFGRDKHQLLEYFSEIRRGGESMLFHRWLKNDQVIQVKQFTVKGGKGKLSSSRKFGVKDVGVWHVILTDKHGKVLSRSSFDVVLPH
jgi:Protein of unknown function (DUF2914)